MKYLLVFVVVMVAFHIWRNNRRNSSSSASTKPGPGQLNAPQDMVSCPVCAVHLPRNDALAGPRGLLYCSEEHRRQAGH